MTVIKTFDGIKIKIHYNDHQPPHAHVYQGGQIVSVEIKTLEVTGTMSPKALKKAVHWIKINNDLLTEEWEKING